MSKETSVTAAETYQPLENLPGGAFKEKKMEMDKDFESRTPARKLQKIDALVLGFNFLSEVFEVASDLFASATMLVAAHANYNVDKEQFRIDAAHEIETLTGEQDV